MSLVRSSREERRSVGETRSLSRTTLLVRSYGPRSLERAALIPARQWPRAKGASTQRPAWEPISARPSKVFRSSAPPSPSAWFSGSSLDASQSRQPLEAEVRRLVEGADLDLA